MMECYDLESEKSKNWLTGILNIFTITETSVETISQQSIGNELENKLQDLYFNAWFTNINSDNNGKGNKLRTYCTFKQVELSTVSPRITRK